MIESGDVARALVLAAWAVLVLLRQRGKVGVARGAALPRARTGPPPDGAGPERRASPGEGPAHLSAADRGA